MFNHIDCELRLIKWIWSIDINEKDKPETDIVSVPYAHSDILNRFPKLTKTRNRMSINKPQKHNYLKILKQVYLNHFHSATASFMQTMVKTQLIKYMTT